MNNQTTNNQKVFIYGVPGSGKSTFSKLLSKKLKLALYEADKIKLVARYGKTIETDPYYFIPTTSAYKVIGERTPENVINGMLNVRKVFNDLIEEKIKSFKNGCVVESAFLNPAELKAQGIVILLTTPSETQHKKQFLIDRTNESITNGQFDNARLIQKYLISEAKKLNIQILKNNGDINNLLEQIQLIL
jgi:2-phosphoglycerate kinase